MQRKEINGLLFLIHALSSDSCHPRRMYQSGDAHKWMSAASVEALCKVVMVTTSGKEKMVNDKLLKEAKCSKSSERVIVCGLPAVDDEGCFEKRSDKRSRKRSGCNVLPEEKPRHRIRRKLLSKCDGVGLKLSERDPNEEVDMFVVEEDFEADGNSVSSDVIIIVSDDDDDIDERFVNRNYFKVFM